MSGPARRAALTLAALVLMSLGQALAQPLGDPDAPRPRPLPAPAERPLPAPNEAIYYQIFVRSFADSDGDGIGDFEGIRQRLPYLAELGVGGLWLTPIHPSPSYHGYDVVDYWRVDPQFGTLSDLHRLIDDAHALGMRMVLDFVVNHSSSQHPDFQRALAGNPAARERYVFSRDPNPTVGTLGAPAWHRVPGGTEFYYGVFTGSMPDLNHRNPEVVAEMLEVAHYWIDQGFDGLRVDAIQHIVEGADGAIANAPENFEWVREFGAALRQGRPGAFMLGETWTNTPTIASYHLQGELDMSMDYPLFLALIASIQGRNAADLRAHLRSSAALIPEGAWVSTFTSNHDQLRPATVLSPLRRNPARERLLAQLLFALPGIPFLYYGQEIGMPNGPGDDDREKRTPMRWSATADGGFSTATPWHPPSTLDPEVSVEAQRLDPDSTLNAYRQAIVLRRSTPALAHGRVELLETRGGLLGLWRRADTPGELDVLVLANLAAAAATLDLAALGVAEELQALAPGSGPAGPIAGTLEIPGTTLLLLTPVR